MTVTLSFDPFPETILFLYLLGTRKTRAFSMFLGGMTKDQWHKMDQV